ncbi:alpha/beta fold hydrolase [Actinomyces sp. 2119]|uniref:alpha/beta fold hydrolase n=1 Tax=Actinomyces sp. 2119 TaxID=2321393 RepID=UPI000E6BA928|nr:alpha/beta fold hydrolase [Actinomyces sp. 2119]RJF41225.1 alpha/beta fold hydrolase [Actinomyces sp. 2119]
MRHRHSRLSRLASGALALGLALPLATFLPLSSASAAGDPAPDPGSSATDSAAPGTSSSGSDSAPSPATPGAASPGLQRFYDQGLAWVGCEDGSEGYECATLTVPLDYDQPDGQTITLALKRLPASDGDAEGGSLFLNPGGPGGSGVDLVPAASTFFTPETLSTYDVIGFDPRGVGSSTPLTCWSQEDVAAYLEDLRAREQEGNDPAVAAALLGLSSEEDLEASSPAGPMELMTMRSQADSAEAMVAVGQEYASACETYSEVPEILDHMDTVTVTRDMDVMRQVVGDQKLNYLGISYGTYLGAFYADLFPDRVGRTVLDSAMDPSITRSQVHADNVAHYEYTLRTYVESCLGEQGCPLSGTTQEALDQLDTFLTGLDADPLPVDDQPFGLDREQMLNLILRITTQNQGYWPYLTEGLAQAMNERNGTTLVDNVMTVSSLVGGDSGVQEQLPTPEQVAQDWNSNFAFYGVHCSDYPDTGDEATWDAHAADLKESYPFFYNDTRAYIDAFCHGWGHAEDARDPAPLSASGSDPILVVGVYDDSQTPYPWSVALADQLEAGHLLSVNEALHGSVGRNTCSTQAINTFLTEGTLPQEGQVCPTDPLAMPEDQAA